MAAHTRPTVAETQKALLLLKSARADLANFIDPVSTLCGVPEEVRREAERHFYLSTWVQSPLDLAIEKLEKALGTRSDADG